jgi:hypothetical protein
MEKIDAKVFILGLSNDWLIFWIIFYDGPINDAHHERKKIESWASPMGHN